MKNYIIAALVLTGTILILSGLTLLQYQLDSLSQPEHEPYEYPEVFIRSDSTVEPASAPINSDGNYYTLEAPIEVEKLVIERSNTVFDGNGYYFTSAIVLRDKGGFAYGGSTVKVLNAENVTLTDLTGTDNTYLTFENSKACKVDDSIVPVSAINSQNILVSDLKGNVNLTNSIDCTITSCQLYSATLKNSHQNRILNNDMTDQSKLALSLEDSDSNLIFGNRIEKTGKLFEITGDSNNNLFVGNYIHGEFRSSPVINCSGANTFYHNTLSHVNWNQTATSTPNNWDNGSEGNYWNDYQGTDTNHDGIGDTPHQIDPNNTDNYPLMKPIYRWIEPQPEMP